MCCINRGPRGIFWIGMVASLGKARSTLCPKTRWFAFELGLRVGSAFGFKYFEFFAIYINELCE